MILIRTTHCVYNEKLETLVGVGTTCFRLFFIAKYVHLSCFKLTSLYFSLVKEQLKIEGL
jgi:hypothetical protein